MAPRAAKRKAMEGDQAAQAKPKVEETVKRVTRSMTKQPDAKSQPNNEKPKAKSKAKPSPKGQKGSVEEDAAKAEASPEEWTAAGGGSHNKTVVVEHCKQCNSFKTRAFQVRDGLQKGVPGVNVLLNPDKHMKRPFKPMKELDMEKVVADIIEKIK
ncbi:hypothetical protein V6N11_013691 [Hibiscus sabdariffa]|uniref:Selenoprotein H n=1 Tax=Hibiscus sabdariffa TaxID=183260 RepID=A0ABR2A2B6_9ROSI